MLSSQSEKSRQRFAANKQAKKDRHMHTVAEFSQFLEHLNEDTVQQVLLLTRTNREALEELDADIDKFCRVIDREETLLGQSEDDLLRLLQELQGKILAREEQIKGYGEALDATETHRAAKVSAELKKLVDTLVAIAHELPDDIERYVAEEAFEVNNDVITNRMTHARTVGAHQIKHVQLEDAWVNCWENTRKKWRQLRHDQAVNVFREEIRSPYYNDPEDRLQYMEEYRREQLRRQEDVEKQLQQLQTFTYDNISVDTVQSIKANLADLHETELLAMQSCLEELNKLNICAEGRTKARVEAFRKELHIYGALQLNPKLHTLSGTLSEAIDQPELADYWRLAGGMKTDFQSLVEELQSEDVVYDNVVDSMHTKLSAFLFSFDLKAIMEEKGRLSQLDKVRNLVTKLRSAPRAEVPGFMRQLIEEAGDICKLEKLSNDFKVATQSVLQEMTAELLSYEERLKTQPTASVNAGQDQHSSTVSLLNSGALNKKEVGLPSTTSQKGGGAANRKAKSPERSLRTASAYNSTNSLHKTAKTAMGATQQLQQPPAIYIDPLLLKVWHRKLGIFFYASDLPTHYQQHCALAHRKVEDQRQCNALVNAVVTEESEKLLRKMQRRYEKCIQQIISYLEVQDNFHQQQLANVIAFYLKIARRVEAHRAEQTQLDNAAADELWDLQEDSRILLEDLEEEFRLACKAIRESIVQEDIDRHFQSVLQLLERIQQAYRDFHEKSCFAADKYPLRIAHAFVETMNAFASLCFLHPQSQHTLLKQYDTIFDEVMRLNRARFEADALAAGIQRLTYTPLTVDKPLLEFTPVHISKERFEGSYHQTSDAHEIYSIFCDEFGVVERPLDDKANEERALHDSTKEAEINARLLAATAAAPHKDFPWMRSDSTVLPVDEETLKAMDELDLEDYETALIKGFVQLPELPEPAPTPVPKGGKPAKAKDNLPPPTIFPYVSSLTEEQRAVYENTKQYVLQLKEKRALLTSLDHIRSQVPSNSRLERPWVEVVELSPLRLSELYRTIRQSLMSSVENVAFKKIVTVQHDMTTKKAVLTNQLEERLRQHWPRRGRVETEIKKPREAELLSHKEKTWRLIQNVQGKMTDLQDRFLTTLKEAQQVCDTYVQEMTQHRNALAGDFKNLAALQGIDVKARACSLAFSSHCQQLIAALKQMTEKQTHEIQHQARDFRKLCPLQQEGTEGGYSETEIESIAAIMEQQCAEIDTIRQDWEHQTHELEGLQGQSMRSQQEFSDRYQKVTQEVAMAEGLGQKYGAPRRRAQERIRTEISQDERRAGSIDALLAELEFVLVDVSQRELLQLKVPGHTTTEQITEGNDDIVVGGEAMERLAQLWQTLKMLRNALHERVAFLNVYNAQGPCDISIVVSYINIERLWQSLQTVCGEDHVNPFIAALTTAQRQQQELQEQKLSSSQPTIEAAFDEVNKLCRQETTQLYESEGLKHLLGAQGVPESLEQWLAESREKILGPNGYRERAWKRLWTQLQRVDEMFFRFRALAEDPTYAQHANNDIGYSQRDGEQRMVTVIPESIKHSIQTVSVYSLLSGCLCYARKEFKHQTARFAELLVVWEKARQQHERLLKPRLGSPDKIDELNALASREQERVQDLRQSLNVFRSQLLRSQLQRFRYFVEDIVSWSKGFCRLLDSCPRQELVVVPPDMALPKKHLTLKKLRKVQRRQEEVKKGQPDKSQRREWPPLPIKAMLQALLPTVNALVHDLGSQRLDLGPGDLVEIAADTAAVAAAAGAVKEKKATASAAKKPAADATPPAEAPSLLPVSWQDRVVIVSSFESHVSAAHRIVVIDRDHVVGEYVHFLQQLATQIADEYEKVLQLQHSWTQRWERQVDMLRQGQL